MRLGGTRPRAQGKSESDRTGESQKLLSQCHRSVASNAASRAASFFEIVRAFPFLPTRTRLRRSSSSALSSLSATRNTESYALESPPLRARSSSCRSSSSSCAAASASLRGTAAVKPRAMCADALPLRSSRSAPSRAALRPPARPAATRQNRGRAAAAPARAGRRPRPRPPPPPPQRRRRRRCRCRYRLRPARRRHRHDRLLRAAGRVVAVVVFRAVRRPRRRQRRARGRVVVVVRLRSSSRRAWEALGCAASAGCGVAKNDGQHRRPQPPFKLCAGAASSSSAAEPMRHTTRHSPFVDEDGGDDMDPGAVTDLLSRLEAPTATRRACHGAARTRPPAAISQRRAQFCAARPRRRRRR